MLTGSCFNISDGVLSLERISGIEDILKCWESLKKGVFFRIQGESKARIGTSAPSGGRLRSLQPQVPPPPLS